MQAMQDISMEGSGKSNMCSLWNTIHILYGERKIDMLCLELVCSQLEQKQALFSLVNHAEQEEQHAQHVLDLV